MSEACVVYLNRPSILESLSSVREGGAKILPGTVIATMYGNTLLYRGYCPDCKRNAFVEQGRLICCGDEHVATKVIQARGAISNDRRRTDPDVRDRLAVAQGGLCYYCARPFWCEVYRRSPQNNQNFTRKTGLVVLRPTIDHFVPYAYCQSEAGKNKVAACHICNSFKHSIVFLDLESAREYLELRWRQRGYRDDPS